VIPFLKLALALADDATAVQKAIARVVPSL
jgi:hypothetical protein